MTRMYNMCTRSGLESALARKYHEKTYSICGLCCVEYVFVFKKLYEM